MQEFRIVQENTRIQDSLEYKDQDSLGEYTGLGQFRRKQGLRIVQENTGVQDSLGEYKVQDSLGEYRV